MISNLTLSRARWRSVLLLIGGALVFGAIACSSDDPEPTAVPPAPTTAPAATAEPVADSDAMTDDLSADLMMAQNEASVIVPLDALNDSGQSGVAILIDKGSTTEVVVDIGTGAADVPQPIHIHAGTCDTLGDVAHALSNVVNGRSVTTVEASLAEITTGGFTINAHKSGDEIAVYVACGNVPSGDDAGTFALEAIDDSGQHGSVSFIDLGGSTAVVVSVGSADAGLEQPIHIHAGTCDALGDIAHALTNVVDGRSLTVIDDSISNVMRAGFAVNLHKSGDEIAIYTACGEIGDEAMTAMDGGDAMLGHLTMVQTDASIIVPLAALNGSGQSGVAILLDQGDTTEVVIDLVTGAADVPQPIHIHAGTCDNLGDVAHALSSVVNGRSVTTVEAALATITTGGFTINAHKSGEEIAVYVACGNVPSGDDSGTFALEAIDGSGQDGSVSFIGLGSSTAVVVSVGAADAGLEQPIHIHAGTCDNLGAVAHALTSVVDGRSLTVIDDSISNLMRGGFAVNLHKSGDEIAIYTACGEISDTVMSAMDGGDAMSSGGSAVLSDIAGFQLETLSISVGDTITWTNQDNAPHTVSNGVSPDVDGSPQFQSATFNKDGTYSHTFDTAGTFPYFCEVHPSMIGSITVK